MTVLDYISSGELYHFEVKGLPNTSRKDLDYILIHDYLQDLRNIDTDFESESDFDSVLKNLQILTNRNESTVSGMLLFGKEPQIHLPQSGIALHRFDGIDRSGEIMENRELNGPIPYLIESAIKFMTSNNSVQSSLTDGQLRRVDSPDYEITIFRELIANAFQHRDWSVFGQKIKVQMFSDRIEIFSPGKLPNTMTLENALMGVSFYRNPMISQVLRDYGLIDKMGRGLFKVTKLCREKNLPRPQFLPANDSFTVILPRRINNL